MPIHSLIGLVCFVILQIYVLVVDVVIQIFIDLAEMNQNNRLSFSVSSMEVIVLTTLVSKPCTFEHSSRSINGASTLQLIPLSPLPTPMNLKLSTCTNSL